MAEEQLTKKEFHETITKMMGVVALREDVRPIIVDLRDARQRIEMLINSVDRFTALQGKDHDELMILRSKYDRMASVLVRKHIATEEELRP